MSLGAYGTGAYALNQEWMVACLCGHLSEARIGSVRSQRKTISLSPHEENELIQGAAKKAASLGKNRVLAQEGN